MVMPPRFSGATYSCPRHGSIAKILRLSLADLRRNGFALYQGPMGAEWLARQTRALREGDGP
jgi:hypothetical protein